MKVFNFQSYLDDKFASMPTFLFQDGVIDIDGLV